MAALEPLYRLVGIDISILTKKEVFLLEAEIFASLCKELKEIFREQYKNYFRLMKFTIEMKNHMLNSFCLRLILKDILLTEEYDLNGLACYTDAPQDVNQEIIDGRNIRPTAILLQRSIDLHREVRASLYQAIIKKVAIQFLTVA